MLKTLCVLAYPILQPDDAEWIDRFRAAHDARKHAMIRPHITLVFPTDHVDAPSVRGHVQAVAGTSPAIRFTCRRAMAWPEREETLVYLVPEEGWSALSRLHQRLHSGPLAIARQWSPPFLPHITIGRTVDYGLAQRLCDDINGAALTVPGVIETLTLTTIADGRVADALSFRLSA